MTYVHACPWAFDESRTILRPRCVPSRLGENGDAAMRKALTDAFIQSLKPPADGRTEVADIRSAGLSFRVSSNGARSWCFRFRDPRSRKTTRATIGEYPTITLSEARRQAEDLRRLVAGGNNPVTQKRCERDAAAHRTFQTLAERYLNEHARRHKRSAAADERNLRLHVLPRWRNQRYDEIARGDIIELVEGLVTAGKPTLANRIQALVSSLYSFAMDADLVKGNPCARLRRRGVERVRRRVLTDDEIHVFWPGIVHKPVSRRVGLALRLVLLTGVRPGEAAGLARSELENINEPDRARWIIPAARSKNGRAHLVPLSELARQTVLSALALPSKDGEYLFTSPSVRGAPITAHALAVAMARFADNLDSTSAKSWQAHTPTPHDLRRTLATRLAELGVAKEDRDAVLNHTPRDVGKRHYDIYERDREKRRALALWASTLEAILEKRDVASVGSGRG
jgi:integrase